MITFVMMKLINFTGISFFFCMLHLLLQGTTPQPGMAGEKLKFMLKIIIRVVFSVIFSQNIKR